MILTEKYIDEIRIRKLVGKPIAVDLKKPKAVGGPGLFLKSFKNKTEGSGSIKTDSKCNIEKRTGGIVVHTNFSNTRTLIVIPEKNVLAIKAVKVAEVIKPMFLSPMWILLKLGVSIRYARYFALNRFHTEYSIGQMELAVKATEYEIGFIANGYLFDRQADFLKSLNYGSKLTIMAKSED